MIQRISCGFGMVRRILMENTVACPVCGLEITSDRDARKSSTFYCCPVCGRFEISDVSSIECSAGNQLAPYLFYHHFSIENLQEYRYHTTLDKRICDEYKKEFNEGNNVQGYPVHMDAELISTWYPKTFSEKIDLILLRISELTPHMGQYITFGMQELFGLLFVDRKEKTSCDASIWEWRDVTACEDEAEYVLKYLADSIYIECIDGINEEEYRGVRLTPKGYARVDELQKNTANGRNVLVAMKFGEDTRKLREAIRQGVGEAGYFAIFIDEVQHNDFITPELLKYIRDSKFVVVDLTHQNNGAYFEEGYAMGVGKTVIQLCKKDTNLHFDIAQKNTIMWDVEDSIPLMLKNRIIATID